MLVFKYGNGVIQASDPHQMDKLLNEWIENNWQEFNHWVSNKGSSLIKDNVDDYVNMFYEEHVEEIDV